MHNSQYTCTTTHKVAKNKVSDNFISETEVIVAHTKYIHIFTDILNTFIYLLTY